MFSSSKGKPADNDLDIEKTLASLTTMEKVALLGGKDFWHIPDFPEKGIPAVRMSDGPNGVRGIKFFNGTPSNCFPCATGLASSFDLALAKEIGVQLGEECRVKGAHILLGPTINIQRSPLGGRGFESFSEDPHLSGKFAASWVNGLQSQGVAATMKHFVGNEQEFERLSSDSVIPDRALREIYLEPFRITEAEAKPKCYMTSYNRVNGLHCSESKWLLEDILRKEWGFEGIVMSDWTGVYSCDTSIKAGLDLEMPGPPVFRGAQVLRQLQAGKIFMWEIDDRVRKVLGIVKYAKQSGIPFGVEESKVDNAETRALLRKAAAAAVVLLKNDKQILPIKEAKKIAVIGSNARVAVPSGGGSASMLTAYAVTPLEGITSAAEEIGAEVEYSIGSASYLYMPSVSKMMSHPNGKSEAGFAQVDFWKSEPAKDFKSKKAGVKVSSKPDHSVPTGSCNCFMMDGVPHDIAVSQPYVRYTSKFTPDTSGTWKFGLASIGAADLYVNGQLVVNNSSNWVPGETYFNSGSIEQTGEIEKIEVGQTYDLEIRSWYQEDVRGSPFQTAGAFRFGAIPVIEDEKAIAEAVIAAKNADVAIVVVGLNEDFESEGYDRKHMDLPGTSNKLVRAILEANPRTIIVNQTGTPVAMPWVDQAHSLVQAFYGGNSLGDGLADVLFGKVNPSSKLSLTFPKRLADSPSDIGFGITSATPGKTFYTESIYVGYRYFDKSETATLFPFGYGLSYTTFAYSDLQLSSITPEGEFEVSFIVENTGKAAGKEAAQIYVRDPESSLPRAVKELKGFAKVELRPGQKETVTVNLDRNALKYWDERRNWWIAEAGEFDVMVGSSSVDLPLKGTIKLEKSLTWTGL
ncbi:hypothetical protein QFC22_001986 [Naganishia vaughanmartiniae]|uniref:Uncharacterized protein n=1 Tax=Naganishia vaughanmartiniae TaxID=1424756 RepID=A0ACC2XF69_9TREE|nr:hypothetical protein QFC22_001986 [Naganishia vaughanmartiniae]